MDVDGVIADGWHRQHHLQGGRRDWKGFFEAAVDDTPVVGSVELLSSFNPGVGVVLLTARPHTLHQVTLDWLAASGHRWDLLIMRRRRDAMASPDFKSRSLTELVDRGFDPTLVLDDDRRNIEMAADRGFATWYVHSGYYEA